MNSEGSTPGPPDLASTAFCPLDSSGPPPTPPLCNHLLFPLRASRTSLGILAVLIAGPSLGLTLPLKVVFHFLKKLVDQLKTQTLELSLGGSVS